MASDSGDGPSGADLAPARRSMLKTIDREISWFGVGNGSRTLDPRVRAAMLEVPRERFVPPDLAARAYDNQPLPIGHGQTISQPLIVAAMSHLLQLRPEARVLEVGTGSGYQTAVLAELAAEVVTIEVLEALAADAKARLAELGYRNVECHLGDGAAGCPERAPFDAILVTAAARSVPPALVEQLKPGGRMVIPVGGDPFSQDLLLIEKDAEGRTRERNLFAVAFVPLRSG
jgi:protein-L-isoaspartate(D-aspartate) O-methyltransferase